MLGKPSSYDLTGYNLTTPYFVFIIEDLIGVFMLLLAIKCTFNRNGV